MHYRTFILAVLFSALQAPDRATLEGVITRAGTTETVPRVSVVVTMVQGQLGDVQTVLTDDSGRFAVRNLRPGAHRIFATTDGYVRGEYGQRAPGRPGTPVDLMAGENRRGIAIAMTPTAVIAGRIVDADGKPMPGVFVRIARTAYPAGTRELTMVQRLQTNDLGEFRFFGLEPGPYYVMALPAGSAYIDGENYIIPSTSPPDFLGAEPDVRLTAAQALAQGAISAAAFREDAYQTTYYPGTKDQTAAMPINLEPGAVFSGVELRIQKSAWVHIRGRVVDAQGQPAAPSVTLSLPYYGTDQRNISGRAVDGVFDLHAPPGTYQLTARVNRSTPGNQFGNDAAYMNLEVGDRDIDNIQLKLFPSFSVNGKMTFDGTLPGGDTPDLKGVIINLAADGSAGVQIRPNTSGAFSISYVSRTNYRIALVLIPANTYIKSARLGSKDVIDGTLPFETPPQDLLEIILRPTSASFSAIAVDEKQQPLPGVTVVLVPDSPRRGRRDLYRTAVTDASGRINLTGITPGEYKAFAWENIQANSWQDPEVLRPYENVGQLLRLNENSRESMTLRVIR